MKSNRIMTFLVVLFLYYFGKTKSYFNEINEQSLHLLSILNWPLCSTQCFSNTNVCTHINEGTRYERKYSTSILPSYWSRHLYSFWMSSLFVIFCSSCHNLSHLTCIARAEMEKKSTKSGGSDYETIFRCVPQTTFQIIGNTGLNIFAVCGWSVSRTEKEICSSAVYLCFVKMCCFTDSLIDRKLTT